MIINLTAVVIAAIALTVNMRKYKHNIRKENDEALRSKADNSRVDKLEKDLKEEIKCIEESNIRENKELKEDYQKEVKEVKIMLRDIHNAILNGKIQIKK